MSSSFSSNRGPMICSDSASYSLVVAPSPSMDLKWLALVLG
jgi:hypothetical protein